MSIEKSEARSRRNTRQIKKAAFSASLEFLNFGGDEGDRTPDLGIANAALSQLSYIPGRRKIVRMPRDFVKDSFDEGPVIRALGRGR
jgi:hypothetical protein